MISIKCLGKIIKRYVTFYGCLCLFVVEFWFEFFLIRKNIRQCCVFTLKGWNLKHCSKVIDSSHCVVGYFQEAHSCQIHNLSYKLCQNKIMPIWTQKKKLWYNNNTIVVDFFDLLLVLVNVERQYCFLVLVNDFFLKLLVNDFGLATCHTPLNKEKL